jgi:hypothetical protein
VIRQIADAIFDQRTRKSPMVKVRQMASPVSPGWTVGGNCGPVGYRKWQCGDFHVVPPVLIKPDHRVRHVRFLETSDFVFGQPNINRGQRIVEVLELGGADDRRGYDRLGQ